MKPFSFPLLMFEIQGSIPGVGISIKNILHKITTADVKNNPQVLVSRGLFFLD
jgi:hypothetical protein